jgi:hypothetical protein
VRRETIQVALQQYEGDAEAVARMLKLDTLDMPE